MKVLCHCQYNFGKKLLHLISPVWEHNSNESEVSPMNPTKLLNQIGAWTPCKVWIDDQRPELTNRLHSHATTMVSSTHPGAPPSVRGSRTLERKLNLRKTLCDHPLQCIQACALNKSTLHPED